MSEREKHQEKEKNSTCGCGCIGLIGKEVKKTKPEAEKTKKR